MPAASSRSAVAALLPRRGGRRPGPQGPGARDRL